MSTLIEELKKEHSELIEMLHHLQELGFHSRESQHILLSAKDKILSHLEKENEKLYPAIRAAAEKDERLKQILDIIAKDLENVKKLALLFYEKYSSGGSGFEYSKNYGEMLWVIKNRIQREEDLLFKEYDNLCNKN